MALRIPNKFLTNNSTDPSFHKKVVKLFFQFDSNWVQPSSIHLISFLLFFMLLCFQPLIFLQKLDVSSFTSPNKPGIMTTFSTWNKFYLFFWRPSSFFFFNNALLLSSSHINFHTPKNAEQWKELMILKMLQFNNFYSTESKDCRQ